MRIPHIAWATGMATALTLGLTTLCAHADDASGATRRTITVTGNGEVSAAPDMAVLAIAIETTAANASDAAGENANRSAKVATALKSKAGADDKVSTARYTLEPQYEAAKPGRPSEPRIAGYIAHNEVRIETHKLDAIGSMIDGAIGAGANRVNSLQFILASRNDELRAALEKAGIEATAQAESIAKALGVKLKGVVSATSGGVPIVQPRYAVAAFGAMAREAQAPTSVEPNNVSVSASVTVTYEIE